MFDLRVELHFTSVGSDSTRAAIQNKRLSNSYIWPFLVGSKTTSNNRINFQISFTIFIVYYNWSSNLNRRQRCDKLWLSYSFWEKWAKKSNLQGCCCWQIDITGYMQQAVMCTYELEYANICPAWYRFSWLKLYTVICPDWINFKSILLSISHSFCSLYYKPFYFLSIWRNLLPLESSNIIAAVMAIWINFRSFEW